MRMCKPPFVLLDLLCERNLITINGGATNGTVGIIATEAGVITITADHGGVGRATKVGMLG